MLFGTSRHTALGTSAIEAILTREAVSNVVGHDALPSTRLNASICLCFCVSIVMLAMRLLRLGMVSEMMVSYLEKDSV